VTDKPAGSVEYAYNIFGGNALLARVIVDEPAAGLGLRAIGTSRSSGSSTCGPGCMIPRSGGLGAATRAGWPRFFTLGTCVTSRQAVTTAGTLAEKQHVFVWKSAVVKRWVNEHGAPVLELCFKLTC